MVVIPGAVESISAVRRALEWPFHDLVVVERTRVNFSVSFVELGSVYAKHPPSYMGKPLFRPTALITAMLVSPCFTRWFSVVEFSLSTTERSTKCLYHQCRSKGNITGGARERRRREPLGGSGGMLPQKILKARGLEMLFPAFSKSDM